MTFIVKQKRKKEYEQPAEGSHLGALLDVHDCTKGDGAPRVRFTWILATLGEDGQPLRAFQAYPQSMSTGSHLRKAVTRILGCEPEDDFDLDTLIGRTNMLVIEHNGPFVNVTGILKSSENVLLPANYIRMKDRNKSARPKAETDHRGPF